MVAKVKSGYYRGDARSVLEYIYKGAKRQIKTRVRGTPVKRVTAEQAIYYAGWSRRAGYIGRAFLTRSQRPAGIRASTMRCRILGRMRMRNRGRCIRDLRDPELARF